MDSGSTRSDGQLAAYEEGQAMALDQAVEYTMADEGTSWLSRQS